MALIINKVVSGLFSTNTYILEKDNEVVIIDPVCRMSRLEEFIGDKKLLAILLTHGHFDHIKTVDELYKKYNMDIYVHKDDEYLIRDKKQANKFGIGEGIHVASPCLFYKEGILNIGSFNFEIIFTSGHTRGSVCIKIDDNLFTGDTLFNLSIGRTDLDGGNDKNMKGSLLIIKKMDENLKIYPGHGDESVLKYELLNNIYLKS